MLMAVFTDVAIVFALSWSEIAAVMVVVETFTCAEPLPLAALANVSVPGEKVIPLAWSWSTRSGRSFPTAPLWR